MIGAVGAGVLRSPANVKGSMFISKTQYKYQSSGNMTIDILLCNILLLSNEAMTGFNKRIMKKLSYMSEIPEVTELIEFGMNFQEYESEDPKIIIILN